MTNKIKIITAPDFVHDRAVSYLLIHPANDLKKNFEEFLIRQNKSVNVYLYSDAHDDVNWLLTAIKFADYIIIDIDQLPEKVNHFTSFILSFPNTYYRTEHLKAPWELLNQNRFFEFPNIESEE